ncbi:MAG: aminotransferase class V-fold PLP-dependent enzyme [Clostridia bacterium]|nr:aminotransferase class V-fold PLP-dependent enzyme [Clostridia bacterium]
MDTPIADFVKNYIKSDSSRFHMPGHKGKGFLGFESYDITEIDGADVLGAADGIIKKSEDNASSLFSSAHTFYTTQGSSTAICAMLSLVRDNANDRPLILAARNVHKSFIHACALLDYDIEWIMPREMAHITKCIISSHDVETAINSCSKKPSAVFVTSPDYLGNIQDIASISEVCHKHDVPLLADNAHGAYLAFTNPRMHPLYLGADACADSAHKTLPVLTGGAYLHVSPKAPKNFLQKARDALTLFSSTSPSYLILQSLDICNAYLSDGFEKKLSECIENIKKTKKIISENGFCILGSEPLKIVIDAKESGFIGYELADILKSNKNEPEFYDEDYVVLMITPENRDEDFERIKHVFETVRAKMPITKKMFDLPIPSCAMTVREAMFSHSENVDVSASLGKICAMPSVSCPPAVPIAVSGEVITEKHIALFEHYGIDRVKVVLQH